MIRRLTRKVTRVGAAGAAGLVGVSLYKAPPSAPLPKRTTADVVVVGFGLAGGCCALEAASACSGDQSVLVLDRFDGGGASVRSGGVVYSGGGTEHQKRHGFEDSAEQMQAYLKAELGEECGVSEEELKDFCEHSKENLEYLEKLGAKFTGNFCTYKTSYPTDEYTLYYSGSESSAQFKDVTPSVPRGHRAAGKDLTGHTIFNGVRAAVKKSKAIRVCTQTSTEKLLIDDEDGRVAGVRAVSLGGANRLVRGLHHILATMSSTPSLPGLLSPAVNLLETFFGEEVEIWSLKGVVLCAGGYNVSSSMVDKHAPAYKGCLPIGTPGDDGKGIRLGEEVGAATKLMHRCSGWKFINPPASFIRGVLVTGEGNRMGNEDVYGARLVDRLVEDHGGKGWLIIDQDIWNAARQELNQWQNFIWFQSLNGFINLYWNHEKASSIAELESKCNIGPGVLQKTLDTYNAHASKGEDPQFRKNTQYLSSVSSPPYYAINYAQSGNAFVTMFMSLGGLSVNSRGQVLRKDGAPIQGLFAAGRNACGIPSSSYVSGLSLADCVWSGRRAGRSVVSA